MNSFEPSARNTADAPADGLPEIDVRAIVRLLADVAIVDGDHATKKRALMDGLQQLVDADGWLWSMTRVDFETQKPMSIGLMHGGLSNEQITGWVEASQIAPSPPPEDAALFAEFSRGGHFTRTRQQLVSDDVWYTHPSVKKHRLQLGIDHFLYSVYPLDEPKVVSAIGLFRRTGRSPFTARQRRIAHVLLAEVDWLHAADLPPDKGRLVPLLTPRQRVVMVMLLEAYTAQEIAQLLHISPLTVKDHIKAVYRHLGVSGHLELLRRFKYGNGRDLA